MRDLLEIYRQSLESAKGENPRRAVLQFAALELTQKAGLSPELLQQSRLGLFVSGSLSQETESALRRVLSEVAPERLELGHALGHLLDRLISVEGERERGVSGGSARKKIGSFYTPRAIARRVVASSLPVVLKFPKEKLRICDPAAGGGAFLLEAAVALGARMGPGGLESSSGTPLSLCAVDTSADALAVLEVSLFLLFSQGQAPQVFGSELRLGDALTGRGFENEGAEAKVLAGGLDFSTAFPGYAGFDWLLGNPPWVAYQGRAARPLAVSLRSFYRERYRSFHGYPTLHGMFVERAAELAREGVITLLLPSSLSDLTGYENVRVAVTRTHQPVEPLEEFGQDAFEGVVQPCFAFVATPRSVVREGSTLPWSLSERTRTGELARVLEIPPVLRRLGELEKFPKELFREMGFQTNRHVSEKKLFRGPEPQGAFTLPLLEGKNVREFVVESPRVFLDPDRKFLQAERVTLREPEAYEGVAFVVRQTASYPIAALHTGYGFRNSLLAGFELPEYSARLTVALLNSSLLRAFHLSNQRDARQAAFPQVKVAHLRNLPAAPRSPRLEAELVALTERITTSRQLEAGEKDELDRLVFELYHCSPEEREEVRAFLLQRAPGARRTSAR